MKFNLVVSINTPVVGLLQQLGFEIVGMLPRAFRPAEVGLVDAYVVYRFLAPDRGTSISTNVRAVRSVQPPDC
jgi:hypothetical protein